MFVGLGAFVVNEFSHGPVDLWIVMWQWIGMFLPKPVAEYPSAMINRLWSVFGDSLLRSNPETRLPESSVGPVWALPARFTARVAKMSSKWLVWSYFGGSWPGRAPEAQNAPQRALWGPFGPARPGSQPEWPK
jgi:hypothetical protein